MARSISAPVNSSARVFSKAGIDLVLVGTDMAGWAEKVGNWDYEIDPNLLYQLGDPALGVARTYISSNIKKGILFSNTQGYSNPEVDRLFEEAALALDEAKRQELYSKVQEILVEEVPVAWTLELEYPIIYDKAYKNIVASGIGSRGTFGSVFKS